MTKQFTTKTREIDFQIDEDTFKLRPVIPAAALFEFANIQSRMEEAQKNAGQSVADVMLDAFSKILDDPSFEMFNARFFGVTSNPMDFATFTEVTEYILAEVSGKGDQGK